MKILQFQLFSYQNEEAIGKVLAQRFKDGKLKREDIFVTTKVSWFFQYFFVIGSAIYVQQTLVF